MLFVDEAWQLPHHLFDRVAASPRSPSASATSDSSRRSRSAPTRGAATPATTRTARGRPTSTATTRTWRLELPAVWRPPPATSALWRAFYPEWEELDCVAAPGDRALDSPTASTGPRGGRLGAGRQPACRPCSRSTDCRDPEARRHRPAADRRSSSRCSTSCSPPGSRSTRRVRRRRRADRHGQHTSRPGDASTDPLVAILATRNQAVDDAADAVDRLRDKHWLAERDLVASTVDSWQGQTNGITVAVHPLTGASQLDEFNSAFGRLAVTCTRATHGLLMVSRPGLDELLREAPARPGTPFGEPGNRQLPRQTHQRILATFARGHD